MDQFAVIEFEEYPDEWVRVRLSGVSMRTYEAVVDTYNEAVLRYMPDQLRALRSAVLPVIDSWSFPEPVGEDGLAERDPNWLMAVGKEWVKAVRNVPLPLPRRSSDGEPSEDQSPSTSTEPTSTTSS